MRNGNDLFATPQCSTKCLFFYYGMLVSTPAFKSINFFLNTSYLLLEPHFKSEPNKSWNLSCAKLNGQFSEIERIRSMCECPCFISYDELVGNFHSSSPAHLVFRHAFGDFTSQLQMRLVSLGVRVCLCVWFVCPLAILLNYLSSPSPFEPSFSTFAILY